MNAKVVISIAVLVSAILGVGVWTLLNSESEPASPGGGLSAGPSSGAPAPHDALDRAKIGKPTGVKPNADNTGIRPGSTLATHEGDYVADVAGERISNLVINGDLYLAADDITVENVKVNGDVKVNIGPGNIYFLPVKKNHTLINVDVQTVDNVGLDNLIIDRSRIRGVPNTFHIQLSDYREPDGRYYKADRLILTNNLFDPPLPVPESSEAHLENLHLIGVTNAFIANNVFDMTAPDQRTLEHITATFFQQTVWDVRNANAVIDGNYFYGGGYFQVYLFADNMKVTNNKFHSYPRMGAVMYPPSAYEGNFPEFEQSGNTLDGKPYTIPFDE